MATDRLHILGYNPQSAGGGRLSEISDECSNFDFVMLAGAQRKAFSAKGDSLLTRRVNGRTVIEAPGALVSHPLAIGVVGSRLFEEPAWTADM